MLKLRILHPWSPQRSVGGRLREEQMRPIQPSDGISLARGPVSVRSWAPALSTSPAQPWTESPAPEPQRSDRGLEVTAPL